ncbi:TROVE domain-containing protein [Nocardiopsis sp. MG754419]|uniref:TROVE domain-containing protein n=1 Tax=Nocardiopsis sp. MG754419 TaxID=2259865 RepID=UPI001BA6B7F9|nr:TROVE domain-containing protein [Nocardiopsis sp. MG754419]
MSKFNRAGTRPATRSPLTSEAVPTGRTHEGAPGYARELRSELWLLAVHNMVGENTFYETAGGRDDRFTALVHQVAVADPEWFASFVRWLRRDAHMRSASLVAALEGAKARLDAGEHGHSRQWIDTALARADEPGEALAYWTGRYGRRIPKPVKRGIADAARRLYTERSLLKYDTSGQAFRFADVLDLTHPPASVDKPWQGPLFEYAHERRRNRGTRPDPERLPMLASHGHLMEAGAADPALLLSPERLERAGVTWETALSLAGDRVDKAELWESLIPSMGYMALLRNLRNFDEAGVSDAVAEQVAARLKDPEEVARSRQMPMRFLSAHRAAPSLRWGHALEKALTASLSAIPALPGRTLILVDTSSSMGMSFAEDGSLMRWDAAALFGIALGHRCANADVVSFSSARYFWGDPRGRRTKAFPLMAAESVLGAVTRWKDGGWFLGGGTETGPALRQEFRGHDRVVIVTDEQASGRGDVDTAIPQGTPMYTWNLAGYEHGHAPSGRRNRHTFGGLTDAAFRMIPLLESGRDAHWPWEH